MEQINHIYTDGSSKGNPGPGGYCVFIETFSGTNFYTRKILYEGYRYTTNNRMELLAVITGLENIIKNKHTIIFTDSKYIIDPIQKKWIYKWNINNFYRKKNIDLWRKFLRLFEPNFVIFCWIKSHNNNYVNDFCDYLSAEAYKNKNLKIDYFYEKNNTKCKTIV